MMGLLFLVYGLVIGSFLNVVIYRIPANISISSPPSTCGSCGTRIKAKHLVPIFSYLFLKGKCAYCDEKISLRYPIIEGLNGITYLMVYLKFGSTLDTVLLCLFSSVMIVIAMIDYDTTDVYFSMLIPGGILAMALTVSRFSRGVDILPYLLAGGIGMGFIYLVILVTKGGMGHGDIWILGLVGVALGPILTIVSFFFTSIIGGITAVTLLILKKKTSKEGIPFGPFLIIGFFITLFAGENLLNLYLNLFNL